MPIVVRIDVELAKRKMSVGEFAERVGLTPANVAVLKNGRAKAVRFSTLEAMCRVLECQPGDCSSGSRRWATTPSLPRGIKRSAVGKASLDPRPVDAFLLEAHGVAEPI